VPVTLRFAAEYLGKNVNDLATQITENTERVYGSWSAN
jgi:Tat protein secretion system quality control protein TatD with DNase activity